LAGLDRTFIFLIYIIYNIKNKNKNKIKNIKIYINDKN
tara:strand:+ start:638 stop:751 length:114 start_codon:yes stop_codon:yes gene_type:complete